MLPPLPTWLVKNVTFPVYRGIKKDILLGVLEELERNQWLDPGEIKELQWNRLKEFLRQITSEVPYYRGLFRKLGISPQDIRSPADFENLDFLTKDKIREAGNSIISENPDIKGIHLSTGGSTGDPLFFEVDVSARPIQRANTLRNFRWMGIDIGDRRAHIWGTYFGVSSRERTFTAIRDYFNNRLYLSSFTMSEEAMEKYAARLRRFKPHIIIGYPSALTEFAEFCKRRRVTGIRPRALMASGERIYPHQKQILESVFACPVFIIYGTNEFATVAGECEEHNGLHVFDDMLYVEIITERGRPAQSGEIGEIVITDLTNFRMPFLRYRTGDLAVPTDMTCPCGRGFPLIDRIEGRAFDVVVSPNGKSAGGFFWTFLSRAVPGIKRFQIEQRDRSGVIFRLVPGSDWRVEYKADLEKKIRENFGEDFGVIFDIVDDIPLTPSGKFRFIVSKVEERLVVKSKIHKARVTGEVPGQVDSIVIDEDLLERSNISLYEKVLIVDNTNGARIDTFVRKGEKGKGEITVCGAATSGVHTGDEIIVMAFTWSEQTHGQFKNILVDENNHFVRYLKEVAGEKA